ncbi:MAG: diacylglycerol kinase family protein [bacterium]|nr:diacylglycerol kinase family protein [bacterium]
MKKRLVLVINSRSSGFKTIQTKILPHLNELQLNENQLATFEIQPTTPIENAHEMAKMLHDDDVILVAGGDGTAHIATNAAMLSGKKNIQMKYTGFGNFNDYANSFSKNSGKAAIWAFENGEVKSRIRPLEIRINGEFFRYAPLYATVGLTAEMAEIFESKKLRKVLKKFHGRNSRLILSLIAATRFYFRHRQNYNLAISKIEIDGKEISKKTAKITDLVFMNGPRMARIMRSKINKTDAEHFGFTAMNAGDFRANIPFLVRGFLGKIPLQRIRKSKIEFEKPAKIALQIEGEATFLREVKTLEICITDKIIEIL